MNSYCRQPRKKQIRSLAELLKLKESYSTDKSDSSIPIFNPSSIPSSNTDVKLGGQSSSVPYENIDPSPGESSNEYSGQSYRVLWMKPSARKKRVWEGDGCLNIQSDLSTANLLDDDGKLISTAPPPPPNMLFPGSVFKFGSKEVEIVEPFNIQIQTTEKTNTKVLPSLYKNKKFKSNHAICNESSSGFVRPYGNNSPAPLILPTPPNEHQWKFNINKNPVISIKVDTFLTLRLRPHQRKGVIFLYECVMGFKDPSRFGAILADEMGLGKTLQCISLIWTLLKHGPYGICIARSVLVIAPTTLCSTWNKEFLKWLGRERLQPYLINNSNKPSGFLKNKHMVMIISYERLIKHITELEMFKFDLIVCDEAHRLKNSNVKTAQALQKLCCLKRVLLTGTPIQNDLQEFFVLSNVANPGIFGSYADFKNLYEDPILHSQIPDCSDEVRSIGEEAANRLNFITSSFLLRRTQNVLKNILPTKTEYVLCCELTKIQKDIYSNLLEEWWNCRDSLNIPPLTVIVILKKICNHPLLFTMNKINSDNDDDDDVDTFDCKNLSILRNISKILPDPQFSSTKILVLQAILKNAVIDNNEKVVVVSCSTQVLDIIAAECKLLDIISSRLDGSTPIPQRQRVVDNFNSRTKSAYSAVPFVLLLSSRAGGIGLSLPAASRLILFDSDWNPAIDNQAMARIWRDGQKKPVHIYRFITTGTIEEKIYQRQMFKTGLSDAILDSKLKKTLKLCDTELKDLFTMSFDSESTTHDMLKCSCFVNDQYSDTKDEQEKENDNINFKGVDYNLKSINQLKLWEHLRPPYNDEFLKCTGLSAAATRISFIFRKISEKND